MQIEVKEQTIVTPHYKLVKVVDGDGLFVENIFSKKTEEIRLLGIDAPETRLNSKIRKDEMEVNVPYQLLLKLGNMSLNYLIDLLKNQDNITLIQEVKNPIDAYGRKLCYIHLSNGVCVNELMILEGYAKPYNKVYCSELPLYQKLNLLAKTQKKGLYSIVSIF